MYTSVVCGPVARAPDAGGRTSHGGASARSGTVLQIRRRSERAGARVELGWANHRPARVCLRVQAQGGEAEVEQLDEETRPRIPLTINTAISEEQNLEVPQVPVVQVEVVDKPGAPLTINGGLDVASFSLEEVYSLLTDHESSNRIFRTILDVQRTDLPDGSIRLVQNCQWKFAVFSGSFPVELEVREDPQNRSFSFRDTKDGGFMKEMYGQWAVLPSDLIPGGVHVQYTMSVRMALAPPPPFGHYTSKIFVSQVTEILTDLQLELERSPSRM